MQRRLLLIISFCFFGMLGYSQFPIGGTDTEIPTLPELNVYNYRTFNGTINNLNNTLWGAAGTNLTRKTSIGYRDRISSPAGQNRPNPRQISNELFAQAGLLNDVMGLSDYCWVWGQFIDHDIGITPDGNEPAMINVPAGDPWFDPMNSGSVIIPMMRNVFDPETGTSRGNPRQHPNLITAYIDGSGVYGSDEETANWLRTFTGGKLKSSADNMLPFNTLTGEFDSDIDPNAPHMDNPVRLTDKLYVAGDVRANENPLLLAFHTLFMREHNRLCDDLAAKYPDWNDERLYQHARKIVGALIQSVVYHEWLPAMGVKLQRYQGYKDDVNPQLTNVFTAAAFRLGHTLLNGNIIRMKNDGDLMEEGNLSLRDAFFNPLIVEESGGIEPFLKGMGTQVQQSLDSKVIDDVRNFLFGPPGAGGLDLASININRGRERGLPDFNTVRQNYGLPKYFFFQQLNWDYNVMIKMVRLYKNINKVDPWVGMLVERPRPNELFGETIMAIMKHQFSALRDGDRFYYENDPALSPFEKGEIRYTTLHDIIMRNTSIELMQRNVFRAMDHDEICNELPGSILGTITSVMGSPIPGVNIFTSSTNTQLHGQSNSEGTFSIEGIPGCEEFQLSISMKDVPNKGINTLDLIKVQKHILGIKTFDSPYKMIAADINRSSTITTADLLLIRKIVLGLETNLSEDALWLFLPEELSFDNTTSPLQANLPNVMDLGVMQDIQLEESFIGIKLGDVDFSALPASLIPRSQNTFQLSLEEKYLQPGQNYEVLINTNSASDLSGLQLALGYNQQAIELIEFNSDILTGFSGQHFHVGDGSIKLSWNSEDPIEVLEGSGLLKLRFKAKQSGSLSDIFYLDRAIAAEAYNPQLETSAITLETGPSFSAEGKEFELYQNQPNPFISETFIPFYISKGGEVRLTVFDVLGRNIYQMETDFPAGYHQIRIEESNIQHTGTLFYQLETPNGLLSKSMIKQ